MGLDGVEFHSLFRVLGFGTMASAAGGVLGEGHRRMPTEALKLFDAAGCEMAIM